MIEGIIVSRLKTGHLRVKMPREERCERLRVKQLNEAVSSTPKLSSFGFVKTSGNSSQTLDSNNSTTNLDA